MSDEFKTIKTCVNPLDGAEFTACSGPMLVMRHADDCARFSLRISKDHLTKAVEVFAQNIPARIGKMSSTEHKRALCLGPDEWFLLAQEDQRYTIAARFAEMSEQTPHSLVDISHRNVGIEVSGPAATLALNAGCPFNLDALPIGGCARTILDKAQIVLMKFDEDYYRLEVLRSFADFVWNFLSVAGREIDAAPNPQDLTSVSL